MVMMSPWPGWYLPCVGVNIPGVALQSIQSNCPQSLRNNLLIPPSLCYYLSWGGAGLGEGRLRDITTSSHVAPLPSPRPVMNIVMDLLRHSETHGDSLTILSLISVSVHWNWPAVSSWLASWLADWLASWLAGQDISVNVVTSHLARPPASWHALISRDTTAGCQHSLIST